MTEKISFEFPVDVFEDVKMASFFKHNKKHVTEDYVAENFKEIGWRVYRPFNDTGIDLIATKNVCPKGHTELNKSLDENFNCPICNATPQEIKRFIQVKTREVKGTESFFGYTLSSDDFRCDPRHVFLLYSDRTNEFIMLPMLDYLKIFHTNQSMGLGHFGTPSFRVGNNKLNGLCRGSDGWFWSGISFNGFINENGLRLISDPSIDNNIESLSDSISALKFKLFYTYCRGKQGTSDTATTIQNALNQTALNSNYDVAAMRRGMSTNLAKTLSTDLKQSVRDGYFIKFKGVSFDE